MKKGAGRGGPRLFYGRRADSPTVCSLAAAVRNGWMIGWDIHVRFCEGVAVRFPCAARRNIYVRTKKAEEQAMGSLTWFLEKKRRLEINREKSPYSIVGHFFIAFKWKSGKLPPFYDRR